MEIFVSSCLSGESLSKNVKKYKKLSKTCKTAQIRANLHQKKTKNRVYLRSSAVNLKKQSQYRPAAGNPKHDNSGVFSGCLLPGVVPETLNPKQSEHAVKHGSMIVKTNPIVGNMKIATALRASQ